MTFTPTEKQQAILDSDAPLKIFVGGVCSGKWWLLAYEATMRAARGERVGLLVQEPFFGEDLIRSMLPPDYVEEHRVGLPWSRVWTTPSGGELLLSVASRDCDGSQFWSWIRGRRGLDWLGVRAWDGLVTRPDSRWAPSVTVSTLPRGGSWIDSALVCNEARRVIGYGGSDVCIVSATHEDNPHMELDVGALDLLDEFRRDQALGLWPSGPRPESAKATPTEPEEPSPSESTVEYLEAAAEGECRRVTESITDHSICYELDRRPLPSESDADRDLARIVGAVDEVVSGGYGVGRVKIGERTVYIADPKYSTMKGGRLVVSVSTEPRG